MKHLKTYLMQSESNKLYEQENKKFIEYRILKIKNKYAIFSIHKKTPDIYTGLYTHMYDGKKIKPFNNVEFFGEKYPEYEYDELTSIIGYDDYLANGINKVTIYITDNIDDAFHKIKLLYDTDKYNI